MVYKEEDLEGIDALTHIRMRPQMYVWGGHPDGEVIAARLVVDVLVDTNRLAFAARIADWWIVASDKDWIDARRYSSITEYFKNVAPFPEAGDNAFHGEVLATAFAKDVVTYDRSSQVIVQGTTDPLLDSVRSQHPEWVRVVAFRMG
jgi:hypothetical protein